MAGEVIGPVLLERECDGGLGDMSEEERAEVIRARAAGEIPRIAACWTRFRWWFGSGCMCPECGRLYNFTMGQYKSGKYHAKISS